MIGENKKAVIWSGVDKVAGYVVHFAIQVVLARLLMPDDYTVVAMLAIFFAISQAFIDSGFATTLIQRKNCTESDYNSVFYFNIAISVLFYAILFVCAPLIESFYHFPNLAKVTRIYAFTLVISSIGMVNRVILTKELKFKKIAIVSLAASLLSAVPAIVMAYNGYGYWALVFQNIVSASISVMMYFYYSRWFPKLIFSFESLRSLAPFGLRILVVYIFHAIYNNIYSLLIGKRYAPQELGYFDRGKTLAGTGSIGFSDFFTRALYPIQSKQQDNKEFLEDSYNRSFSIASVVIVPICVFLCVFSVESIYTLFGEQWLNCSKILAILSIGYLFYPLQAINMNMLKVGGRADYLLRSELLKKTIGIIIVLVAINFSIDVVVWGWTCCALIEFAISEFFYIRLYHFRVTKPFIVLLKQIGLSTLLALGLSFLFGLFTDNKYVVFFGAGILFVLVYGVGSFFWNKKLVRNERKHCI